MQQGCRIGLLLLLAQGERISLMCKDQSSACPWEPAKLA